MLVLISKTASIMLLVAFLLTWIGYMIWEISRQDKKCPFCGTYHNENENICYFCKRNLK